MSAQQKKPRKTLMEEIKGFIKNTHYNWLMVGINYEKIGLSEKDYLEIAKYAINLYPDQMDRLRDDKLSPQNYYEVCQIMAKHGAFSSVKCDKLKQVRFNNLRNPIYEIMFTALNEWCFTNDGRLRDTPKDIYNSVKEYKTSLHKEEYARVVFLLWLCKDFVSTEDITNMVENHEIQESDVLYVTNVLLEKISMALSPCFTNKIDFDKVIKDVEKLPQMVKNACDRIGNAMFERVKKIMPRVKAVVKKR